MRLQDTVKRYLNAGGDEDARAAMIAMQEALETPELTVGVLEGGLLNDIFILRDGKADRTITYAVLDWDVFKNDPVEFWTNLVDDVKEYIKKELPEEWNNIKTTLEGLGVQP